MRPSYRILAGSAIEGLSIRGAVVTVASMRWLSRILQIAGLTIPLVAILAQLNESISPGALLGFLAVSMILFSMGRLLER
jgi:hypothetical protein